MSLPNTPYPYSDALRARAADLASLTHFVGPKNIAAVRMTLLILADIADEKTELIHTPPPVPKRRLE